MGILKLKFIDSNLDNYRDELAKQTNFNKLLETSYL
jgi:hypothetical protein